MKKTGLPWQCKQSSVLYGKLINPLWQVVCFRFNVGLLHCYLENTKNLSVHKWIKKPPLRRLFGEAMCIFGPFMYMRVLSCVQVAHRLASAEMWPTDTLCNLSNLKFHTERACAGSRVLAGIAALLNSYLCMVQWESGGSWCVCKSEGVCVVVCGCVSRDLF